MKSIGLFLTHLEGRLILSLMLGVEAVLLLIGYLAWLSFCRTCL